MTTYRAVSGRLEAGLYPVLPWGGQGFGQAGEDPQLAVVAGEWHCLSATAMLTGCVSLIGMNIC